MKVVHIESGLGNQMLSYCEYLAMKQTNPEEPCYIEKIVYDIPAANDYINQWNGYELERIFGIKAPDVMDLLSPEGRETVLSSVKASRFWLHEWNWPVYFTKAFVEAGLPLVNARGDFEENKLEWSACNHGTPPLSYRIKQTGLYANIRRLYKQYKPEPEASDMDNLFYSSPEDQLIGQRLSFKFKGNGIERIDRELREAFRFPPLEDEENRAFAEKIDGCEAVAIHVRRGDMLPTSGKYYKSGYFRRAVKFMKKHVKKPVFFFFCDPDSAQWCRDNNRVFGLNPKRDEIVYVSCNGGENSYRDMQLMARCKHNIVTNSSFGWWGAYLNQNPGKITISPEMDINTTHHM